MDFGFDEEQQDLQGLATQILEGELSHERLKEVEGGDENFDRELWAKLAEAGILGIALPEANGGGGYGYLETALVLEQVGRTVAPVPYYATVIGVAADREVRHRRAEGRDPARRHQRRDDPVGRARPRRAPTRCTRSRPRSPTATAACSTA